ncbi:lipid A biosynthesis lauroyl acyltransferase [Hydrogenimonas sp.]
MKTQLIDALYVGLFHGFRLFVRVTPGFIQRPVLRAIALAAYLLDARHRRIARVNLDLAFGDEMKEKEKKRIVRRTYENLLLNVADFVAMQGMPPQKVLERITFENEHYLTDELAKGKPVILITAHYGDWELLPRAFTARYGPLAVVGRPLDSQAMNEILERYRKRAGIRLIHKKGAMKGLVKALKEGMSVGLLVDQNTAEKDGILVDFFGKEARHTPAASILARKFDTAIVPVFITADTSRRFTIRCEKPIRCDRETPAEEAIFACTQAQARVTEAAIRRKPDEWFWLHQRWKNRYEALYNEGAA